VSTVGRHLYILGTNKTLDTAVGTKVVPVDSVVAPVDSMVAPVVVMVVATEVMEVMASSAASMVVAAVGTAVAEERARTHQVGWCIVNRSVGRIQSTIRLSTHLYQGNRHGRRSHKRGCTNNNHNHSSNMLQDTTTTRGRQCKHQQIMQAPAVHGYGGGRKRFPNNYAPTTTEEVYPAQPMSTGFALTHYYIIILHHYSKKFSYIIYTACKNTIVQ
jgi:hypothetical protein